MSVGPQSQAKQPEPKQPRTKQPQALSARGPVPLRKGMIPSPYRPGDPLRGQEKKGIGWGGILVGGAVCLFVAYVWNAGGLQTSLDDLFGGWNHSLRGQDALVAKWYLTALPILATTLVVALLYFLLSSAVGKAHKAVKRKQKRSETPMVAAADANVVPQAKPGMSGPEFVRPVRLVGARDESVLVKTLR